MRHLRRRIVDLRTEPERVAAGYFPAALSVPVPKPPLDATQSQQMRGDLRRVLSHLDLHTPIAVFCAKGVRSKIGVEMLRQMGFVNVVDWGAFDDARAR